MAVEEIPVFREAQRGQVVRSSDWNGMQQQLRNSVRTHRHARVEGDPVDDTAAEDLALQIATDELADGAVTSDKIADDTVQMDDLHPDLRATIENASELGDDVVLSNMIAEADGGATGQDTNTGAGVKTGHLQNGAVTGPKIDTGAVALTKLNSNLRRRFDGTSQVTTDVVKLSSGELISLDHGLEKVPVAIILGVIENRLDRVNSNLVGDFEVYGFIPNLLLEGELFAAVPTPPDGTFLIASTAQEDRVVRWWAFARTEDVP